MPERTVALLQTLRGVFIMGNHDREVLQIDPGPADPAEQNWTNWTRGQLSERSLSFLASFRNPMVVERQGLRLRLVHGDLSRERYGDTRLWPDSPESTYADLARRYAQTHILFGHSHVQYSAERAGRRFVNPGGLGQPRLGQTVACYAVLEGGRFDLRAVRYNVARTAAAMDELPLPRELIEDWKQCYLAGTLPKRYRVRDFTALMVTGYR